MDNDRTPGGWSERRIERWVGAHGERRVDCIAEEVPVALQYNGRAFAVMMASPRDLDDFAIGFSLSEGLVHARDQLHAIEIHRRLEGIEVAMTVAPDAPAARIESGAERLLPGRSGCGMCGARALEDAVRQPAPLRRAQRVSSAALERALQQLPQHQPMNAATGAVHAAAWADADGRILLAREDVGRHNALDKLIGAMWRADIRPDAGMLLLTSRASYEMVGKAATVGIGFIAAISAPTTLALELARSAGVCLVAFARPDGFNAYTHPERLQQD